MAWTYNPKIVCTQGSTPEIMTWGEASTQSFLKGQFVYLDTSDQVTACASDASKIYGIALEDASGTQATEISIQPITSTMKLRMYVTSGGTATASTSATVGATYSLYVGSNICSLDLADEANDIFTVLDQISTPSGGSTYWALVRPVAAYCQYEVGGAAS